MTTGTATPGSPRLRSAGRAFGIAAALTFFIGPFAWMMAGSFRGETTGALGLENYRSVFHGHLFGRVLLNSLMVASLTTVLALVLSATAAFALARLDVPLRRVLLGAALAASMFPPIATVSPLFLIFRALGLRDHALALVIPYTTFSLPLALWVMTSFFEQLPADLYRAAKVDGASPWQAFRYVYLPLSVPGLATTGLLVFIAAWNEFLYALTFTSSPGERTVPVAISLFAGEHKEPWAQVAAASVIVTFPLVVATLVFQRRIVAGLTAGAIKE